MEKNNLLKRFQSFLYYLSEKTEYKKDKNLNEDKYKIKLITLRNMILRELIYLVDEENQDIKKNICENCNNENLIQYCNNCSDDDIVKELN